MRNGEEHMLSALAFGAAAVAGVPAANMARRGRQGNEQWSQHEPPMPPNAAPHGPDLSPAPAYVIVDDEREEEKKVETQIAAGFTVGLSPALQKPLNVDSGASFQILGADSQILEVTLPSGQSLISQPGNLVHMENAFTPTIMTGGLYPAFRRYNFAGESFYRCNYKNTSPLPATIGLTPHFPAKIVPVNLSELNGLTIKNGAFLAALDPQCDIGIKWVSSLGVGCFGGQGLLLNRLKGRGYAFLNAAGTLLHKRLGPGEQLVVDTHSLVAFENTVKFDIQTVGGAGMVCCGGQGIFNSLMTGPGLVIVQSMSLEKMRAALGGGGGRTDRSDNDDF